MIKAIYYNRIAALAIAALLAGLDQISWWIVLLVYLLSVEWRKDLK